MSVCICICINDDLVDKLKVLPKPEALSCGVELVTKL
jgi:hypothetical protein